MLFNLIDFKKITPLHHILYYYYYYFFNWKFYNTFFFYKNLLILFYLKKTIPLRRVKKTITGNLSLRSKMFFKTNNFKKLKYFFKASLNPKVSFFTKHVYKTRRLFKLFLNCYPLLGQLINTFNWTFENKKIWFRSFMSENFIKKPQNRIPYKNILYKNILYKNIYFNEYNYFAQMKIRFNDFKNFIKITNTNLRLKNTNFYLHAKPYSILNNNSFNFTKHNPYLLVVHNMYKQCSKLNHYFFKITRMVKNKNFENLLLFFSYQKFFLKNRNLIKNWWNLKKNKFNKLNFFFMSSSPSLSNFFFKSARKIFKKQSFFANKFFKNFKFKTYERALKTNTVFKIKKWTKKYQKSLSYFFILFSKNKSYSKRVKCAISHFTCFWNIFLTNHLNFNNNPVTLFFNQTNFNFVKYKTNKKTKHFLGFFKRSFNRNFKKKKLFATYRFPFFSSKHNVPFISSAIGFLNLTEGFLNYFDIDHYSYNVKKKYYSFPLKNEIQKFVMKRYLRTNSILHSKHFKKIKQDRDFYNSEINYQNIKNNLLTDFKLNLYPYSNYFSSLWASSFIERFEVCANDEVENISFFIKKIKFKPGYMTFWREARRVFKEILNLNFKYQKRLTNYILKFNKILKHNLYLNNEMSLRNILQRSRFFFDWNTSDFFLAQGLFYVNGSPCFNYHFQLYVGDFIQMITHVKYYILYRWLSHWISKKKQKLKIRTKKKLIVSTSEEDKTRTNKYPTWILFNKNLCDDIAKFLEIDFFTLSVFVVYEPFTWRDLNLYSHIGNRFSIINMYNWKYIT